MKNIKLLFGFTIYLLLIQTTFSQREDVELNDYIENKIAKTNFVGLQAGYVGASGTIWSNSFGAQNYNTKEKVNDNTLFMIASCSKPVTALAILKLANENKIDLDDDINTFLPFKLVNPNFPDESITYRMLLTHTATIIDNWEVLGPLYTIEEGGDSPILIPEIIEKYFNPEGVFYSTEMNFVKEKPGTHWRYSNMGYTLLGYLIEQISGKNFSEYMQNEIFEPLHMNESFWYLNEIPHSNIANPHEVPHKHSEFKETQVMNHFGYADVPAGQLRTSVNDYLKFVQLLLNDGKVDGKQFISKPMIDLMFEIQYPGVNKYQAIAWNYNEFDNKLYYLLMPRLASHTGSDPGVSAVVSIDRENRIGVMAILNSPPSNFKEEKIFNLDIVKKLIESAKTN